MSNKRDNSNDLNNKVKKKKRIVYGEYKIDRKKPIYLKNNEYKKGLTTDEVEERKENLQVNIDGVIESNFSKTIKIITKVFVKNTFTFFNILYIIVLILLLIAKKWNNPDETNLNFAITDFMFLAIVSVNLIIGIIQETKSKLAINKLKLVTNPKVTLIRNGEKVIVEETEVVLDDIMYLTPGIQIVSDSILLEGEVEVNESQLTGESVPIKKRPGDMIYSGSFMVSGTSYARVEHVGKLNEINKLTSQAKKYVAPNSQILSSLKKLLVTLAIFIVVTSLVMFFSKWPIKDFIEALNSGSLDEAKKIFFMPETKERILDSSIQYIVDAVDTVTAKIEIICEANKLGIPVISAMGTGNKLNPGLFEITDIYKTSVCPLAKVMRKELKAREISKLKVIYSKEEPIRTKKLEEKKPIPGSISFVPSVAGLMIAGEVIKDIIKEN